MVVEASKRARFYPRYARSSGCATSMHVYARYLPEGWAVAVVDPDARPGIYENVTFVRAQEKLPPAFADVDLLVYSMACGEVAPVVPAKQVSVLMCCQLLDFNRETLLASCHTIVSSRSSHLTRRIWKH